MNSHSRQQNPPIGQDSEENIGDVTERQSVRHVISIPGNILHANNLALVNTCIEKKNDKKEELKEEHIYNELDAPNDKDFPFLNPQKEEIRIKEPTKKNTTAQRRPLSQASRYSKMDRKKQIRCNDISISQDPGDNPLRIELHKIRLENAQIRLNIENTKKETNKLQTEIEKCQANISKLEKSKRTVCFNK